MELFFLEPQSRFYVAVIEFFLSVYACVKNYSFATFAHFFTLKYHNSMFNVVNYVFIFYESSPIELHWRDLHFDNYLSEIFVEFGKKLSHYVASDFEAVLF